MKKIIIPIIMLIMLSITAFAILPIHNYNDFIQDDGFFNSATEPTIYSRNIGTLTIQPLIEDLDDDGINEVIIADGTSIQVYESEKLTIKDAISLNGTIHDFMIHEFTDGSKNIVVAGWYSNKYFIQTLSYNGTLSSVNYSEFTGGQYARNVDVNCWNDYCLLYYIAGTSFTSGRYNIMLRSHHQNLTLHESIIVLTSDYSSGGSGHQVLSFTKKRLGNFFIIEESEERADIYLSLHALGTSWGTGARIYRISFMPDVLNPLVSVYGTKLGNLDASTNTRILPYNFDGFTSNGDEIAVLWKSSATTSYISILNSGGTEISTSQAIKGTYFSNLVRGNFYPDTGDVDVGVMVYDSEGAGTDEYNSFVTWSEQTSNFPVTKFYYTKSDWFPYEHSSNSPIAVAEHDSSNDYSELITPYGVLELERNFLFMNEIKMVYENPTENTILQSVDISQNNRAELIQTDTTNNVVKILTDGYATEGVYQMDYSVNPCLERTWKNGTNVQIIITPYDTEGDQVQARAVLYSGNSNEQDSDWSSLFNSGTSITFDFIANTTISSGVILLQSRDTSNPTDILEKTLSFSVGLNGVEFGSCTTSSSTETILPKDDEISKEIDDFETSLKTELQKLPVVGSLLGSVFSILLLWLVVCLVMSYAVFKATRNFEITLFVFAILMVLGTLMSFIPVFWVVVLVIVLIGLLALYFFKRGN